MHHRQFTGLFAIPFVAQAFRKTATANFAAHTPSARRRDDPTAGDVDDVGFARASASCGRKARVACTRPRN